MIIAVSIVDLHKPAGKRHVGTYTFEIDYPGDSHFEFLTVVAPTENEHLLRPHIGKCMSREEIALADAEVGPWPV